MGDLYKEIGGTLHAETLDDMINYINLIIKKDKNTISEIKNRRNIFLKDYLNIDTNNLIKDGDILPSLKQFDYLINDLINNK